MNSRRKLVHRVWRRCPRSVIPFFRRSAKQSLPRRVPVAAQSRTCLGTPLFSVHTCRELTNLAMLKARTLRSNRRFLTVGTSASTSDYVERRAGHIRVNSGRRIGADAARRSTRRAFLLALSRLAHAWLDRSRMCAIASKSTAHRLSLLCVRWATRRSPERAAFLNGLRELGYIDREDHHDRVPVGGNERRNAARRRGRAR